MVPESAWPRSRTSASDPVKMPAALTETDRTPAPDNSSRQPPDSFVVTFTASPFTDICVVRRPATVRYVGGASPSPILSRKSLPFSIAIV